MQHRHNNLDTHRSWRRAALLVAAPLFACVVDGPPDLDGGLRALTITDEWELHDEVVLEDVESCAVYWEQRCAELSDSSCSLARARDTCTPSKLGVVVTDNFHARARASGWLGYAIDDATVGPVSDPAEACESIEGVEHERCLALADFAAFVAEQTPELLELAPAGGLAQAYVFEDHVILRAAEVMDEHNLLVAGASELGWSAPILDVDVTYEYALPHYVHEDNIMMMLAPNGIAGMGTEVLVFMQGPGPG